MMRLSRYERVQALIRNPRYLKDLEEATSIINPEGRQVKYFSHEKQKALLKKYGLGIILDPKIWKELSPKSIESAAIFLDDWTVNVIHPDNLKRTADDSVHIEDQDVLTIQLNLLAPKERLLKKVKEYISSYDDANRSKKRITEERKVDKFKVYDEYKIIKSFEKVAKKFHQDKSTVRKAYYRAVRAIEGFGLFAIICSLCKLRSSCAEPCRKAKRHNEKRINRIHYNPKNNFISCPQCRVTSEYPPLKSNLECPYCHEIFNLPDRRRRLNPASNTSA
jgi:hypothetical protein